MGNEQLQVCLDEFIFRHNRRNTPMAAFPTSLGLGHFFSSEVQRRTISVDGGSFPWIRIALP